MTLLASFAINVAVIALVIGLHYEFLRQMSAALPRLPIPPRATILVGVLGAIVAHSAEIWLFALAYWVKLSFGIFGTLNGEFDGSLLDCAYFSFISYTTVGYGDVYPTGTIRFLAGMESLVGLLLITWTASYLFLEMSRHWHR